MKIFNEIKLAQELIKFPTVKTEDKGIMKFLSRKLSSIGFKCKIIKSKGNGRKPALNLYAKYGNSKRHINFLGHTDVVANLNNWKIPPFKGVVRKGYLNGRGSQDMKGGIACWISAVSNFVKKKKFKGSISIIISADEETTGLGTPAVMTAGVPKPVVSSSAEIIIEIDPLNFFFLTKLLTALIQQAIPPFISWDPLPFKYPFLTTPLNGGIFQLLRFATTSVCPKKFICRFELPYFAYKFKAGFLPFPFDLIILHLKPIEESFLDKNFIIPLSSVLTVGNFISSWANFISLKIFIINLLIGH